MIGQIDPEQKRVTVIGAGVSGLLAAHYLDRAGFDVWLFEASDRAGGLIQTTQTPYGIAEGAAHSFLTSPVVQSLCSELGVELLSVNPDSKARFVLRKRRMRRMPLRIREILGAIFRAYFVLADSRTPPERQTLAAWCQRHLGKAALEYLLTPFVNGIYAARPEELTVGAAFPRLAIPPGHSFLSFLLSKLLRGKKSAPVGKKPMSSPRLGMEALIRALDASLQKRLGERFRKGQRIERLPTEGSCVVCLPAPEAADLLAPADPVLARALRAIEYASLVSVTAFVKKEDHTRPVRGVGVLIPESERLQTLGILFNSSAFEGRVSDSSLCSYTVMLGGSRNPELVRYSDEKIHSLVVEELKAVLGLRGEPVHLRIHRRPRAIPKYGAALSEALTAARSGWCAKPGRLLFGNISGQVSLRGMIEDAQALVPAVTKTPDPK